MLLTAARQDYIEVIYRLSSRGEVRITDIASELRTKLPTVTRMVCKLTTLGYLEHPRHGKVSLTVRGRAVAGEITHLHEDLIIFFTQILGLNRKAALTDVCQIEHGFSSLAAQRLHEFLEHFEEMTDAEKVVVTRFLTSASRKARHFKNLSSEKVEGWRS